MMKYNYVIFGSEENMYRISYYDLKSVPYAKYLWKPIDTDNRLLTNLYRFHTSPKINGIIDLPFKSIWNSWQFKNTFKNNNPICFVFFASRNKLLHKEFFEYLRTNYIGCKIVIFFQDLVTKSLNDRYINIEDQFDLKLSFDQEDAIKYRMLYYPLVYSNWPVLFDGSLKKHDIYFLGKAKNRLDEIVKAFEILNRAGFDCDFYVTGVEPINMKHKDKIHYINGMTYEENLRHVVASNYLLEIMQENGHGYTIRYCEAIMYGKRMITNNPEISGAPFYSSDNIVTFEKAEKIDVNIIDREYKNVDYKYRDNISPIALLKFIDERL